MTSKPSNTSSNTSWHCLLGTLLKKLLVPVGITVYVELPIMAKSPQIDILLLKREETQWTAEQLALLPDGIRESQARHLLLEFKYTESLSENALRQSVGYDFFYKQHQELTEKEVQTFLLIAKQPKPDRLKKWGYMSTQNNGVYRSQYPLLRDITLLSLNELNDEPHNAWVKCFASRKTEKKKAFSILRQTALKSATSQLSYFISGLWQHWFVEKEDDEIMKKLTEKQVMEMGKMWGDVFFAHLTPKEVVDHFKKEELLAQFTLADRLAGIKPEDRLIGLKPEVWLAGIKPQELDEIELYIKKLKKINLRTPNI
jgi:hypothetical protein